MVKGLERKPCSHSLKCCKKCWAKRENSRRYLDYRKGEVLAPLTPRPNAGYRNDVPL